MSRDNLLWGEERIANENPSEKTLILTLSDELAAVIKELSRTLNPSLKNLTVQSVFSYLKQLLDAFGTEKYLRCFAKRHNLFPREVARFRDFANHVYKPKFAISFKWGWDKVDSVWSDFWNLKEVQPLRAEAMAALGKRVSDVSRYAKEELDLIRTTFTLEERDEGYLSLLRSGRAIPLNQKARECLIRLADLYERYTLFNRLADETALSQALALHLADLSNASRHLRFKHILVDEYQDLSTLDMRIIKTVSRAEDDGLFLAGDHAQQVFVKDLDLSRSGLGRAQRRTTTLKLNYRNTFEILSAAHAILGSCKDQIVAQGAAEVEIIEPPNQM